MSAAALPLGFSVSTRSVAPKLGHCQKVNNMPNSSREVFSMRHRKKQNSTEVMWLEAPDDIHWSEHLHPNPCYGPVAKVRVLKPRTHVTPATIPSFFWMMLATGCNCFECCSLIRLIDMLLTNHSLRLRAHRGWLTCWTPCSPKLSTPHASLEQKAYF